VSGAVWGRGETMGGDGPVDRSGGGGCATGVVWGSLFAFHACLGLVEGVEGRWDLWGCAGKIW
jgi:hypothetical protein